MTPQELTTASRLLGNAMCVENPENLVLFGDESSLITSYYELILKECEGKNCLSASE
jgi:hypothetical protein